MDSHEELVDRVMLRQRDVFRHVHAIATRQWIDLDLTIAQIKLLFVLDKDQPQPIGSLAQCLGVGLPAASHLTDRLVQAGLVQRYEDTEDRRRNLARLSPDGADLITRLRQGERGQFRAWYDALDDESLTGLLKGLNALMTSIERGEEGSGIGASPRSLDE